MTSTHYIARARDSRVLELPEEAQALGIVPGESISIVVEREDVSSTVVVANEGMLATLRRIAELKWDMPETDGSETDRLLRDGRDGGMYGL